MRQGRKGRENVRTLSSLPLISKVNFQKIKKIKEKMIITFLYFS